MGDEGRRQTGPRPRGICSRCNTERAMTKRGTAYGHMSALYPFHYCLGSGRPVVTGTATDDARSQT